MSKMPFISIVILTYNNSPILRQCISSALALDYAEREIIVVDNASTDNTEHMVQEDFGDQVRLVTRRQNSATAARNEGYREARGDLVLSLDHDMIIPNSQFLRHAVHVFRAFPEVGLLSVKICGQEDPDRPLDAHWWYSKPIMEAKDQYFFTTFFAEGAAFFRAEALRETDGYDETLFRFAECFDLSMKLVGLGWQILYCPTLSCIELVVSGHVSRRGEIGNYYSLRNRL